MDKTQRKTNKNFVNIYAYGFKEYGFNLGDVTEFETDKACIKFVDFDSDIKLDSAQGVSSPRI